MSYQYDLDWLAMNVHAWPGGDHQPWCYVSFNGRDFSISKFLAVPGVRTCRIDKADWIARRAELQNKPSLVDVPEWASWLAQDSSGQWNWYRDKPAPGLADWRTDGEYQLAGCGEVLGDWRDTIEQCPDMHKTTEEIDTSEERVQEDEKSIPIGHKTDQGKPILGAIPPHAELAVGRVLTFGATKCARGNWAFVEDADTRYMDAALRHLNAHRRGELADDESGESHLAHAACCILFMLDMQECEEVSDGN